MFNIKSKIKYKDYYIVIDSDNNKYLLQILDNINYQKYNDLIRYSNKIKKCIYNEKIDDLNYLYFLYEDNTEYNIKAKLTSNILLEIFDSSSYELTLKKENIRNLNNIYKLLDNKFTYFEIRIREIELNPIKKDIDWIILSKYYILLDTKIYLYDLQQDIFKFIDKNEVVKYGLIPKNINQNLYSKETLLLDYNFYYGPISMLYVRMYLLLDQYDMYDDINKLDSFNQKYFCFMYLYIMILNINLDVILNIYIVSNYVNITKKIKSFITKYKALLEK